MYTETENEPLRTPFSPINVTLNFTTIPTAT